MRVEESPMVSPLRVHCSVGIGHPPTVRDTLRLCSASRVKSVSDMSIVGASAEIVCVCVCVCV